MTSQHSLPHALTIDAEDWSALMCMYSGHEETVSAQFGSAISHVLDLLDEYGIRATFFVVARHAAQEPAAVRAIVERGHEVASHAWSHLLVRAFSPEKFLQDILRSVRTLEDIGGEKVRGHRSPLFSLLPDHVWALEAMAEVGLEYDSSIVTLPWRRGGLAVPDQPFIFRLPSGAELIEFPVPARKAGPVTVRFIGGRGARLLPSSVSLRHLREREQLGLPAMLYAHTYELVPDNLARYLPRSLGLKRLPLALSGYAFQLGSGRLRRLASRLLREFSWASACDVIARLREEDRLPTIELGSSC